MNNVSSGVQHNFSSGMVHHFPGPSYSMFDGLSNEEEAYRLASARVMTKRLEARKRLQEGRTVSSYHRDCEIEML